MSKHMKNKRPSVRIPRLPAGLETTRPGDFDGPESAFADPVGYLARFGLDAELVEVRAGDLAPAA